MIEILYSYPTCKYIHIRVFSSDAIIHLRLQSSFRITHAVSYTSDRHYVVTLATGTFMCQLKTVRKQLCLATLMLYNLKTLGTYFSIANESEP